VTDAVERAFQIRVDGHVPFFLGHVPDHFRGIRTGVIDYDIDSAETGNGCLNRTLRFFKIGDTAKKGHCPAAGRFNLCGHCRGVSSLRPGFRLLVTTPAPSAAKAKATALPIP